MNKIVKMVVLLFCGMLLGGCGVKEAVKNEANIERTGEIKAKSGEEYVMSTTEGLVNVTSNRDNLENYKGKKIKVQGQYSGSTLYIDEIKVVGE